MLRATGSGLLFVFAAAETLASSDGRSAGGCTFGGGVTGASGVLVLVDSVAGTAEAANAARITEQVA